MATESGMDIDAVRRIAARLDQEAEHLSGAIAAIDSSASTIDQAWAGQDAQDFVGWWQHQHRPALLKAHEAVMGLASSARNNASAQETTSTESGIVAGGPGSGGGGLSWAHPWPSSLDQGVGFGLFLGGLAPFLPKIAGVPVFSALGLFYGAAHLGDDFARGDLRDASWDGAALTGDTGFFIGGLAVAGTAAAAPLAAIGAIFDVGIDDLKNRATLTSAVDHSYQQAGNDDTVAYMQRYHLTSVGPAPGHEAEYFAIQSRQGARVAVADLDAAIHGGQGLDWQGRVTMGIEAPIDLVVNTDWAAAQVAVEAPVAAAHAVLGGLKSLWP